MLQHPRRFGTTLVEFLVVFVILNLALMAAVVLRRSSTASVQNLGESYAQQMDMRKAADKLIQILSDGTEVVKPIAGGTLPYLAFLDIVNNVNVVHLAKRPHSPEGPFDLVMQTDQHLPGRPASFTILFGDVKDIRFTSLGSGLVVVKLTLTRQEDREPGKRKDLAAVFEVPLKNFSAHDF
jgi:hypothetical protein